MNTTQVTSTGIAVTLAVVVALGLLFFGPRVLSPFSPAKPVAEQTATTTDQTTASTTMDTPLTTLPLPDAEALPTTLTATDVVVGTGAEAVPGKQVTVNYVGMFPDGSVFDASSRHSAAGFPFTLGAGQVIKGWDQGVAGMKVGGTRRLIIPSDLAYGSQGAGGAIPPNATLIFDVQLLDVK